MPGHESRSRAAARSSSINDNRLDAQDEHYGRLTNEISELRRLIDGISERASGIEGQLYAISERLRIANTPSP